MKKYIFIIILSFMAASPSWAKGKAILIFVDVTLNIHNKQIRNSLENSVGKYLDNLKVKGYRRVQVTVFPINAYTLTSTPFISVEFSGRSDAVHRGKRFKAIQSIKDSLSSSLSRIQKGSKEQGSSELKLLNALQRIEPKDLANKISSNNGWNGELRNVQTSLYIPFRLPLPVKSVLRLQTFWIELFERQSAEVNFRTGS